MTNSNKIITQGAAVYSDIAATILASPGYARDPPRPESSGPEPKPKSAPTFRRAPFARPGPAQPGDTRDAPVNEAPMMNEAGRTGDGWFEQQNQTFDTTLAQIQASRAELKENEQASLIILNQVGKGLAALPVF